MYICRMQSLMNEWCQNITTRKYSILQALAKEHGGACMGVCFQSGTSLKYCRGRQLCVHFSRVFLPPVQLLFFRPSPAGSFSRTMLSVCCPSGPIDLVLLWLRSEIVLIRCWWNQRRGREQLHFTAWCQQSAHQCWDFSWCNYRFQCVCVCVCMCARADERVCLWPCERVC